MNEGKYVIRADGTVRVSDHHAIHAFMACGCPDRECQGRAVGAGFFGVDDGKVTVYGKSTTLGIESKPSDAEAVAKELGL